MLELILAEESEVEAIGWSCKRERTHDVVWAFSTITDKEIEKYVQEVSNASKEKSMIVILPLDQEQSNQPKFAKEFASIADIVTVQQGTKEATKGGADGISSTQVRSRNN